MVIIMLLSLLLVLVFVISIKLLLLLLLLLLSLLLLNVLKYWELVNRLINPFFPSILGCIKLSDLKNCKLAYIFFNTFFNLDKYLEHEQRDPFAAARVSRLLLLVHFISLGLHCGRRRFLFSCVKS